MHRPIDPWHEGDYHLESLTKYFIFKCDCATSSFLVLLKGVGRVEPVRLQWRTSTRERTHLFLFLHLLF
jgi:hypothetical protein